MTNFTELNVYQDKWSRWHDKPCVNHEPKSNNGWIYSAYAMKLKLPIDKSKLMDCFIGCQIYSKPWEFKANRSPGKANPPMSRDEILGMYWCKVLPIQYLLAANWKFSPYEIPSFNLFKTIAAFWRLRNAHRNAVWMDGGEPHVFRFAFSVPIQDRAYMLRDSGFKVPLLYSLVEWLTKKFPSSSNSSKLISWRKGYGKMDREVILQYFGEAHPFSVKVMS